MASIRELAAAGRAALEQVAAGRAALVSAVALMEQAGHAYAALGAGSSQPDLANAAAHLRTAYERCRQTVAAIDQATDHANSYLALIAGISAPTDGPPSPSANTAQPVEPWRLTRAQVDRLRGQLPPEITADERATGRKTHGRWVDANGVVAQIVSGQD